MYTVHCRMNSFVAILMQELSIHVGSQSVKWVRLSDGSQSVSQLVSQSVNQSVNFVMI